MKNRKFIFALLLSITARSELLDAMKLPLAYSEKYFDILWQRAFDPDAYTLREEREEWGKMMLQMMKAVLEPFEPDEKIDEKSRSHILDLLRMDDRFFDAKYGRPMQICEGGSYYLPTTEENRYLGIGISFCDDIGVRFDEHGDMHKSVRSVMSRSEVENTEESPLAYFKKYFDILRQRVSGPDANTLKAERDERGKMALKMIEAVLESFEAGEKIDEKSRSHIIDLLIIGLFVIDDRVVDAKYSWPMQIWEGGSYCLPTTEENRYLRIGVSFCDGTKLRFDEHGEMYKL